MKKFSLVGIFVVLLGLALWFYLTQTGPIAKNSQLAKELHLFIWEEYLDTAVKDDFEKEFGVKIVEDNYGSNEELLAKLQAGGGGYDVIVPSDYAVRVMSKQNLLAQLHLEAIPNLKNISEKFKNLDFDPKNQFSVPYMWGTTGIGYNKKEVTEVPTSWAALFDPAKLEKYKGRISMLNDARECIGATLLYLGFSPNSTDSTELEAAKQVLLKQKEFVAKFDSESFEDSLASNEMLLVHGWSGEIAIAQHANADIGFVIPQEGSLIFLDNLAIPRTSKNQHTAEIFINYLLRSEVSARIVNSRLYASPNEAVRTLINPEILGGPSYLMPENVKLYWLDDLGNAAELYEKIWLDVKGQ